MIHVPCGDTVGAVLARANVTLGAGGGCTDDRPVVVNVLGANTEGSSAMVTSGSSEEKIKAGAAPGTDMGWGVVIVEVVVGIVVIGGPTRVVVASVEGVAVAIGSTTECLPLS